MPALSGKCLLSLIIYFPFFSNSGIIRARDRNDRVGDKDINLWFPKNYFLQWEVKYVICNTDWIYPTTSDIKGFTITRGVHDPPLVQGVYADLPWQCSPSEDLVESCRIPSIFRQMPYTYFFFPKEILVPV